MPQNTLICGHRGARREARENTLASFQHCIDMGADMIELDVRRTKDEVLIVHHDACAGEMLLSEYDYDQIIAHHPDIPTLEEVCRICSGKILMDIELKESGYESDVVNTIAFLLTPDQYICSSFDDRVITRIKELSPATKTGLLLGHGRPREIGQSHWKSVFYQKRLDQTKADWVLFHSWQLYFGVLLRLGPRDVKVGVWTENRDTWIRRLIRDGRVHMICTDRPREALAIRSQLRR